MTIRWDPLLCAATAVELEGLLSGESVRALLLERETRVAALFGEERTVTFELGDGWVGLFPAREPPPNAYRLRHRVREVTSPFDESVITIGLAPSRSREEPLALVLELIGTRRNAVVIEERSRIIRHLLSPRDAHRPLHVGATYEAPSPTGRTGPDQIASPAAWEDTLTSDEAGKPRRRRILERVAWTSSLNVGLLVGDDGWERWQALTNRDGWRGYLIEASGEHQPYPVALRTPAELDDPEARHVRPFASLLEAFRAGRERSGGPGLSQVLDPDGAVGRAGAALERVRKRIRALERELEGSPDPDRLRRTGDLILARIREVPSGVKEASLTDFDGEIVEIRLDPMLAPSENADAYYSRARRSERARASLPDRIGRAKAEARRIERLLAEHEAGGRSEESLSAALGPAAAAVPGTAPKDDGPRLPYRRLWSSGGLEIRIGRGARHNDDLTFRHSAPDDIWLHAQQTAGAHVILRWGRKERPPRRDLTEAASLAALNSGARHSGSVAVGWTRRKYVRKPRGAAPGSVVPDRLETVFVSPDASLPDRLAHPPREES